MQKRQNTKRLADKLYLTDDGIHFDQSQLWLDSKKSGALSFLASASLVRERYKNQVIVSEETNQLLKLYNPELQALTCQYNRPFSIGRYNLELLPSGSILGGSSLSIETEKERILYAPLFSDAKPLLTRASQTKQTDYLILKADSYDNSRSVMNRKKELDRFLLNIKNCLEEKKVPVIFSPLLHSASELCKILSEENIKATVHKHIYDVNKVYENFDYNLGSYNLWNPEKPLTETVLILPSSSRPQKLLHSMENRKFFFINNGIELHALHKKDSTFNLPLPHMNANLVNLIKEVQPKKTYIFGPYAHKLIQTQKLAKDSVELLDPFNQSSLL